MKYQVLGWVALLACPAFAQQAPTPPMVSNLRIFILQGEGSVNSLKTGEITAPVVEVRGENERPIEGAEVVFRMPLTGAGGMFAQQKTSYQTRTNSQGQAVASHYTLR